MLSNTFLFALTATVAIASPISDGFGETELFKRDSVLDARDLELAEMHGVNLTEMYKHSIMKRDDGDHYTIWVDRSYQPIEGPSEDPQALDKRQSARLAGNSGWVGGDTGYNCNAHTSYSTTNSNAPYSGGALALARWGEGNKGEWTFAANENDWRALAIGGSNSGRNALYRVMGSTGDGEYAGVGTYDMGWGSRTTYRDYAQRHSNSWRASGRGSMRCFTAIWNSWFPGRTHFTWELGPTGSIV